MNHDKLSPHEIEIIGKAIYAWVEGPFIDDWEFPIVCSLERHEMALIAQSWPGNQHEVSAKFAVSYTMNNLIGYPHRKDEEMKKRIGATREELQTIFAKWRRLNVDPTTGKLL